MYSLYYGANVKDYGNMMVLGLMVAQIFIGFTDLFNGRNISVSTRGKLSEKSFDFLELYKYKKEMADKI